MDVWFLSILILSVALFIFNTQGEKPKDNIIVVYKYPEKEYEEVLTIVEEIGAKLNISDPLEDVLKAYRSRVPHDEEPIVIHFLNKAAKEKWLDIYEKRQFETYFREGWHLMEGLQRGIHVLEEETDYWAKRGKYYKVWTENNTVLYKKTESGDTYKVKDVEHLHYLYMNEAQMEIIYRPAERRLLDSFFGLGGRPVFYQKRRLG